MIDVEKMKADLNKQFGRYEVQATKMVAKLADLDDRSMEKARLLSYDWDDDDLAIDWKQETLDFEPNEAINRKISVWRGDITSLEIDSIVNAANMAMRGGGGIDGRIHQVAGPTLLEECIELNGCATGLTKATRGHNLPSKYILHTVGPRNQDDKHPIPHAKLRRCYSTCLNWVSKLGARSVAFCCISTGIFGYPIESATHVALRTVRTWLEDPKNFDSVDRIVFCVYNPPDVEVYEQMLQLYFPVVRESTDIQLPTSKKSSPINTTFNSDAATSITDTPSLIAAIKNAHQREDSPPAIIDLTVLETLLSGLDKSELKSFFKSTLPKIIDLASRRKEIFAGTETPLLIQGIDTELPLSATQIACLLACSFLTIMPHQEVHHQFFANFNCLGLWKSFSTTAPPENATTEETKSSAPIEVDENGDDSDKPAKKTKKAKKSDPSSEAMHENALTRFKALLAYFAQDIDDKRIVTFEKQAAPALRDPFDWRRANNKLVPLHVVNAPLTTAPAPQVILLPISPLVAPGLFDHAAALSNTDAFLWSSPEMLIVALISSRLLPNEVIHIKNAQLGHTVDTNREGQMSLTATNGATPGQSSVAHVILVPQGEISLPRHESSKFYIHMQLSRTMGAIRTIQGGKKIAVQNWKEDAVFRGNSPMLDLLVLLSVTSFETLQVGEIFKDKKKMAERLANCPELFLYEPSGTLGTQLTALINVISTQLVQYDILLSALQGQSILDVPVQETGTILEQLAHRFAGWKKEFKVFQKEQDKQRRAKEKEQAKQAAIRRKAMEAAKKAMMKEAKAKRAAAAATPSKTSAVAPKAGKVVESSSEEESSDEETS
jgi:O-acetyl-ADP-ribose deacetylase (regulator of RNase III)